MIFIMYEPDIPHKIKGRTKILLNPNITTTETI